MKMDYPELLKGYKNELVKLQEILMKERENRETDEQNAIELLTKVKEQYDLRFTQLRKEYEDKISQLEQQIEELNEQHKHVENELKDEQLFNQQLLENEQELKYQQIQLEHNLAKQTQMNETETTIRQDEERKSIENEQNQLDTKLIELEECKRKIEELEISLNHKENEISNLKLDLRLAKHDASLNQTKYLRESNRELKEKVTSLQSELREHEFKDANKECELKSLKSSYEECEKRREQLQERLRSIEDEKQRLIDEADNLKNSIKSKDEAVTRHRNTNLKLKETLEKIENQNDYLQKMLDDEAFEKEKLSIEKSKHLKTEDELNAELRSYKKKLELTDQQLSKLKEEIGENESCLRDEIKKQKERISDLERKLETELENSINFTKEIKRLQQDCEDKDFEISQSDIKLNELVQDLNAIKEERSKYFTMSEEWKSTNYSLAKMYDDMSEKYLLAKKRIASLFEENDLKSSEISIYEKEKIQFRQTINQQLKAMQFLQDQLDKATAKKSWFSVGKSDTDCKSPAPFTSTTRKLNETPEDKSALEREQQKNYILIQKIAELERCQKKRKNEHAKDNKKQIKTEATAPSVTEDETTSIKSTDLQSEQTNFKTTKNRPQEEEFTFTDSLMEELAYKDD